MQQTASSERHPLLSLILLLFLAVTGALLFQGIAAGIGYLVYGGDITIQSAFTGTDPGSRNMFRIFTILSFFGTFILPSIFFAKLETGDSKEFLRMNRFVPLASAMLAIMIMFSVLPVLEFFIELNKGMKLPAYLKVVEEWMRNKENEAAALVKSMLVMNSRLDLNINLLMIAIIPAIGEEFFFRGGIQQTMSRWLKSDHAAIWITAIIFSAIHVQFFGFVPRMLLGALLGYLFVWGKSIWLPILAHFTNNAITVVSYYIYQQRGLETAKLESATNTSVAVYIGSAMVCMILLYLYWRSGKGNAEEDITDNGE